MDYYTFIKQNETALMCKCVLSKKKRSVEQHAQYAICVSNTRKYAYVHEISLHGQAGRRGLREVL